MAAAHAAERCAICFEAPEPGAEVCTLRCGHGSCHACIQEWWAQSLPEWWPAEGPTCRKCFAGKQGCVVTTAVPAAPVATAARPHAAAAASISVSSDAAAEPAATAEPAAAAAGRVAPRGSRVGFLYSDVWRREGTVLGLPWPEGHRWQHWRHVRLDFGGVCEVDSRHPAFEERPHLSLEGKIHTRRVDDPDFGSTLTVSNRDSQSNCWGQLKNHGLTL